ncbi:MAG: hypothetical protein JWR83_3318 [Aeromicrobium sp.]|nr:hypothetical protein [Aeromicrobium sp.]
MTASDRKRFEYRQRLEQEAAEKSAEADADAAFEVATEADVAVQRARRIENQTLWVDAQIREAIARGEFDNLPGAGKPIPGIDGPHDPDWWLKNLIERERITGVLPPALGLRTEDAELDERLDRETTELAARQILADFNARIVDARRQLTGGPPVVTPLRDMEHEIAAWTARRTARRAHQQELLARQRAQAASNVRTSWFRRLFDRGNPSVG